MTVYLKQLERDWLAAKVSGTTPQKPLGQLRREYYVSVLGVTSPVVTLKSLEKEWLKQYITDNAGTPTAGARLPTLWKEAVIIAGGTPSKFLNNNKIQFYLNAS